MKHVRRLLSALMFALVAMVITVPAAQAAPDCSRTPCVGLNPTDTVCAKDAKTIAAMDVQHEGMLEMRWSRTCNTSWARFTTYRRAEIFGTANGYGIVHAYVSTWTDQGTQDNAGTVMKTLEGTTWWTKMVDHRRPEVCIGTRLYARDDAPGTKPGNWQPGAGRLDLGWVWGPCAR